MCGYVKWLCLLSAFMITSSFAVGVDEYYFDDEINDQVLCVGNVTQNCINIICLTSENRDCQDDCEDMALRKCQVTGTIQSERVLIDVRQ